MERYKPVDCNWYEYFLHYATLGRRVELKIRGSGGRKESIIGFIQDVMTKSGEEFVVIKDGSTYRLDRVMEIEGIEQPKAC